jgi:hypothetical protein
MKLELKNSEGDSTITDEMLQLFRVGMEIREAGDDERWEEEGGRKQEYYATVTALERLLQRKPWEVCVLDADRSAPPAPGDARDLRGWRSAWEIREALEAAAQAENDSTDTP